MLNTGRLDEAVLFFDARVENREGLTYPIRKWTIPSMRLYRGQPMKESSSRPMSPWLAQAMEQQRHEPMGRASGRWFTDDLEIARWYLGDAVGKAEIVTLDIPDELAEGFRVSNTPETACGLSPGRFSRDPEREFLLPREIADTAVPLGSIEIDPSSSIMDNSPFGGKRMADPAITYEAFEDIDHKEHDARFRKDFALPGDRLRVNPEANITGVDIKALEGQLGGDVLTVSKTIMTGQHEKDILGGSRTSVIPTYEFEGVEGRFPAKAFQHELGDHGSLAVLAMRGEQLWLVPLATEKGDVTGVSGPAREVVGFTGKNQDELDPEGLPGLKAHVSEQPQLGDLYYRTATTFGDRTGPVEMLATVWMSGTDSNEAAIAEQAIDRAVFERSVDDVVSKSRDLLKVYDSWEGSEPSEVNDLIDSIHAREKSPSLQNSGGVLDAADAILGMIDDRSLSGNKTFDAMATSLDQANKAGDDLLMRARYTDSGVQPELSPEAEKLARDHGRAVDAVESHKPTAAVAGAIAAMQGRGV